jgi:hypothetical protein
MILRPWHLLLAVAALAVPLQAGALGGGGGGGLAVAATLDHCGVASGGVSCKIDASWGGVPDADRYTATVTLADGSVRDLGAVGTGPGGGTASLWVPYAGSGVYTVTISAWGADSEGREKMLDEDGDSASERGRSDGDDAGGDEEGPTEPGSADDEEPPEEFTDPPAGAETDQPGQPQPEPSSPPPAPDPPAPGPSTPGQTPDEEAATTPSSAALAPPESAR